MNVGAIKLCCLAMALLVTFLTSGCAVVSMTTSAISVGVTAGSVAVSVAGVAAKGVVSASGTVLSAVTD